jgi:predicted ArsR family transcriptional regulator
MLQWQDENAVTEAYLERVTAFLSERGYLARWERDPHGGPGEYLLHKYNCPYAGVSTEHRELCSMDQTLVNELFAEPCQRSASMVDGSHCCTYRITGTGRCACAAVDVPLLLTIR